MPIEMEQHEWREERAMPRQQELAQRIQLAHASHRLVELARRDGWGQLHPVGRIADSRHAPGQEAA